MERKAIDKIRTGAATASLVLLLGGLGTAGISLLGGFRDGGGLTAKAQGINCRAEVVERWQYLNSTGYEEDVSDVSLIGRCYDKNGKRSQLWHFSGTAEMLGLATLLGYASGRGSAKRRDSYKI